MSTEHAVDPNVEAVRAKLLERSRVGIQKYGTTTFSAGLSRRDWIRHFQLECLDAAVYAEAELNAPESGGYSAADMAAQGAEQFRAGVASAAVMVQKIHDAARLAVASAELSGVALVHLDLLIAETNVFLDEAQHEETGNG